MITCSMPTTSLRLCKHPARYRYLDRDGRAVLDICAQHYRSKGHAHLLRPLPWQYVTVLDLASGVTVERAR